MNRIRKWLQRRLLTRYTNQRGVALAKLLTEWEAVRVPLGGGHIGIRFLGTDGEPDDAEIACTLNFDEAVTQLHMNPLLDPADAAMLVLQLIRSRVVQSHLTTVCAEWHWGYTSVEADDSEPMSLEDLVDMINKAKKESIH